MNIAWISPYDIYRSGGVQSHMWDLMKYMGKAGHKVTIFSPKGEHDYKHPQVIRLGISTSMAIQGTQFEVTMATRSEINRYFKNHSFNLIHIHEPIVPFLSLQVANAVKVPLVCTAHGTPPNTWQSKIVTKSMQPYLSGLMNMFNAVITISTAPLQYLKPIYSGKISIIPLGIDPQKFNLQVKPINKYRDGKINILFLGRLDPRKGVKYLIKAYQLLQKDYKNVRLLIAGAGQELANLQKLVQKTKLSNVEFLGFIDEAEKASWYANCDIYCSPAIYGESLGIVLLEAMAVGKPVVATDIKGYTDVIVGEGKQILAKPKDEKSLAKVLLRLCKDKKLRQKMGKWGEQEAKKYSWSNICHQILAVYKNVL